VVAITPKGENMDEHEEDAPDPVEFSDKSPNPERDVDLAVLGDALQEQGITRVIISYEGSGDSGSVGDVAYVPEDAFLPRWLADKLADVADSYCPDGYENNEGGYGSLTVYPFLGLAALEHYDRYEDSESMDVPSVTLPDDLRAWLTQSQVHSIEARFDGYGDSGSLDEITVAPDESEMDSSLQAALEDFLREQLAGGWEIDDGSSGTFNVEVQTGQVHVDGSWYTERDAEVQFTPWRWRSALQNASQQRPTAAKKRRKHGSQ
jgi:hypothetical protein